MANSSFISKAKNKIIKEFIKDADILKAIDSSTLTINQREKHIGTHIFDYHQNPETLTDVDTFITVQVHIPEIRQRYGDDSVSVFVKPTIEIWIISHQRHMKVDNIPKITANRNDYLSQLIDDKLNGRSDFGINDLKLMSNLEGAVQRDYLYRTLLFQGMDLNDSLCEDE